MTPDQLFSSLYRQRTDLIAMRKALHELTACMSPEMRDAWMQALQTRIAIDREAAVHLPKEQKDAVAASADALERLRKVLATPPK